MSKLNVYLVWQNTVKGPDTYDSFVVIAESIRKATSYAPWSDSKAPIFADEDGNLPNEFGVWPDNTRYVHAKRVGIALNKMEPGIVLTSFNSG